MKQNKLKLENMNRDILTKIFTNTDIKTLKKLMKTSTFLYNVIRTDTLLWQALSKCKEESAQSCITILRQKHVVKKHMCEGRHESVIVVPTYQKDITCLSVHDDLIICASDDASVKVFSMDGVCKGTYSDHNAGVWTVDKYDKYIITGSIDRSVIIYDLYNTHMIHRLKGHSATVRIVKCQGKYICSGGRDSLIHVWNYYGECVHVLRGHTSSVRCLDINDTLLVSGSYDGSVILWNYKTGQKVSNMVGHKHRVYCVLLGRKYIASSGLDAYIHISNTHGTLLYKCKIHSDLVFTLAYSDNERYVMSCDVKGFLCKWDIRNEMLVYQIQENSQITSFCIQNDLLFVSTLTSCALYNYCTGTIIRKILTADKIIQVKALDKYIVVGYVDSGIPNISIYKYTDV